MEQKRINFPCPNCQSSAVFYLAENWLKSKENPVKIPKFVYCDSCGYEGRYFKKYLPFIEIETYYKKP